MAEKFKKIDKEFKLSDSTVNCYGFRLMTSGYKLEGFSVNPIGFDMHKRDEGVAVKWTNLRVDGDDIYGTPVVNLSNPGGQRLADEIENGFKNAASMGEFVVLDYTMDEALMLPNQTGPTVTSWYNRECSIVDIPGNSNALCQLFDAGGNVVKLSDLMASVVLTEALYEGDKIDNQFLNFHMKKVTLSIGAGLFAALGLEATATPEQIEAGLTGLAAKADRAFQLEIDKTALTAELAAAKLKLTTLENTTVKLQVTDLLDKAIGEKKITQKLYDLYAVDYATNPTGLKAVLEGHGSYQVLTEKLNQADSKAPAGYEGKTWDELYKDDKLPALKASNPTWYKELHKQKYGAYPEA